MPTAKPPKPEPDRQNKGVGYYEGERFDPGGSPWNIPAAFAWGAENIARKNLQVQHFRMQEEMNDLYMRLEGETNQIIVDHYANQIRQLRERWNGVIQQAETGATGYHAAQKAFGAGMPYSAIDQLRPDVSTGFNITLPYTLDEPPDGIVPGAGDQPDLTYEQPEQPAAEPHTEAYGLSTIAPGLGGYGEPSGMDIGPGAGAPQQPFQPTAAGTTIPDTGMGGLAEGAYAGDVIGGQTPFVDQYGRPMVGPGGGGTYDQLGGGTEVSPFTGPTEGGGEFGIPTPGGRGFATYDQLRLAMEGAGRDRDEYGRVETGVFQPWEIQGMYEGQYSRPDSLQQFLGGARGETYRGLMKQRVDLGQGIQDYNVRRDAYGNIKSFMPASSSSLHPRERLFRRY